jgi:hypothetical protein
LVCFPADEENLRMILDFCANRVMALQELQAQGHMALGFLQAGCYRCSGIDPACECYTPIAWVYASEEAIPPHVAHFLPEEGDAGPSCGDPARGGGP